ncbi:MAG TPA: iron-containing alcohol dehydrogenase [Candidatus Desulfaltia sp.]|nr:iron-containing alcohol dehydrogenase [Candidatus Desulfaltia sp.]
MLYHMPTAVIFGAGTFAELRRVVQDEFRSSRPFLVTDRGVVEAGIAEKVLAHLSPVAVYDEVEPNPRHGTIDRAGEFVRTLRPDLIVGVGGGSALDAAKAIALLATNPGRIEEYEGRERYKTAPLPVFAIPTTCGTGSEVTWVAVITHTGRQFKMSIKGTRMYPAAALVDPDLLMTLPSHLIASTGLDALTHAVEAFTVKPANFISDTLALESIRLIFRFLPRAYQDIKGDSEAREGQMKGSLLAGMAFGNSDVGAVHCLAESVGSLYDTPHGVANAIFLPPVMEFNLPAAREKYAAIAAAIGLEAAAKDDAARALIQKIKDLSRSLSIPSFRDLRIPGGDFVAIARKSFENNSNFSNPREASAEDYLHILRQVHQAGA